MTGFKLVVIVKIILIGTHLILRFMVSTEKVYNSADKCEKILLVSLCTFVILHSDAQTVSEVTITTHCWVEGDFIHDVTNCWLKILHEIKSNNQCYYMTNVKGNFWCNLRFWSFRMINILILFTNIFFSKCHCSMFYLNINFVGNWH